MVEFKKFMFLTALRLKNDKEGIYRFEGNGRTFFRAPFPAPPMIDHAWDLVILYSRNYQIFCKEILGGFLDKPRF
jgi:hypothetical protein